MASTQWRLGLAAGAVAATLAACGGTSAPPAAAPAAEASAPAATGVPTSSPTPTAVPTVTPTATPIPTTTPVPTATATPMPTPTPTPTWFLDIVEIDAELLDRMQPTSWRPGCPVGPDQLRLLRFPHVGFDGRIAEGELVVAADWAEPVGTVFERLFEVAYPIERIRLVDEYGGDDRSSMQANNTSAFNCRAVAGSGRWSNHAFGTAIDLNPLMNPYVRAGVVDPPEGEPYVDRADVRQGMIVEGDAAVEAFAAIGWGWGGHWTGLKDYQHFSHDGR